MPETKEKLPVPDGPRYAEVVERVRRFMQLYPRGKRQIADKSGVSLSVLRRAEASDWCPSGPTLIKLERLMDSGWTPRKREWPKPVHPEPEPEPLPAPKREGKPAKPLYVTV